jgi:hypothetical protein
MTTSTDRMDVLEKRLEAVLAEATFAQRMTLLVMALARTLIALPEPERDPRGIEMVTEQLTLLTPIMRAGRSAEDTLQ